MEQNRLYWDSLAENYCERVISPFFDKESVELFYRAVKDLHTGFIADRKRDRKDYTVLDIGCGKGLFFEFLQRGWGDVASDRHVTGIDFSPEMIRCAKEKQTGGSLVTGDNTLLPFKSSGFDEVYSINSFLVPERERRLKCFAESFRVLKPGGIFTGLFPSNENHLEQSYAMKECFLKKQKYTDEDEALHAVYKELTSRGYDPVGGFIDANNGEMRQKLFAKYELEDLLETTGFTLHTIVPFCYPVSVIKHFDLTVRKNILYDWLLIAKKE
jgi:ubiquinone/menaquinone biosynthesis C-methylase UbiE